jgi:hypothetical protein
MVLNIGVRYDVFSVGDQLSSIEVRDRQAQFSPGSASLSHFRPRRLHLPLRPFRYQIPDRQYIFDNRTSPSGGRAAIELTNETTVAYQAGIRTSSTS